MLGVTVIIISVFTSGVLPARIERQVTEVSGDGIPVDTEIDTDVADSILVISDTSGDVIISEEPVTDVAEEIVTANEQVTEVADEIITAENNPPTTVKTCQTTPTTTSSPAPNKEVLGLNIGLYFVLEEMRRKLAFSGRVKNELIIKVLALSMKIEQAGGEVIPLNKDMMKVLPSVLPASYRNAVCSA